MGEAWRVIERLRHYEWCQEDHPSNESCLAHARCESCGQTAQVGAADSTWCLDCHAAALRLGYDNDTGTLLVAAHASWFARLRDRLSRRRDGDPSGRSDAS